MRIVTWNVNGLRAALAKGLPSVLDRLAPDVLLLQEIRSTPDQLTDGWDAPEGWHVLWHPAEKLGYAGTAIWSRHPLVEVGRGVGAPDPEGRVVLAEAGGVVVGSVYLPSGSSSPERQEAKEAWMARFLPWSRELATDGRPILLAGDLNIAHTERDIWNARSNAKTSGFLPHERAWFSDLLDVGWTDAVRADAGEVQGPYSWWSNRGQARAKDRGWRIDYLLGNAALAPRLGATTTVPAAELHAPDGRAISDHSPVVVDLV
ncbi:MAG: exodeoxyribonuclease III [Alphaproteobacteria bacterium]|nr:exodeoxyribonuclease III [Alphaproteobacteria bacterium]